jgi:hypothetical protein
MKSAGGSKPVTTSSDVMDQPVKDFESSSLLCSATGNIRRKSGYAATAFILRRSWFKCSFAST